MKWVCACTAEEKWTPSFRRGQNRLRMSTSDNGRYKKTFWPFLLNRWNGFQRAHARMELRSRGLPDHHRAEAWYIMSGGKKLHEQNKFFYSSLQSESCIVSGLIDRDLPRTVHLI